MEIEGKYIYKIYKYFCSSGGCGSKPDYYSEEVLFLTENRELAKQVYVFHLTGAAPGEYVEPQYRRKVIETMNQFESNNFTSVSMIKDPLSEGGQCEVELILARTQLPSFFNFKYEQSQEFLYGYKDETEEEEQQQIFPSSEINSLRLE